MEKRLKVLISAYACSPYKGSEPAVGWGFVMELAKHHNLWVLVEEEKFRKDIEHYVAEHPEFPKSIRFFFIHKKRNRFLRKIWPSSYYWYYHRWHQDAYQLAQELHQKVGFDIAHQLTMVGFREPGYLWKLEIPFVWGPIGGMGFFPLGFLSKVGLKGAIFYLGYNLLNFLQTHFSPRPRLAAKAAGSGLIVATSENQNGAKKYWSCTSTLIGEVGLPPMAICEPSRRATCEPLRIVWTGLHISRKALNLGIEALRRLPVEIQWGLHVLGAGARTDIWKKLSKKLKIADHIKFHGALPRQDALSIMAKSHVLLITSLRDLTSTITIEALALGLPIICLDHCGFADVIDETCGIKIPLTNPKKVIIGLAEAIQKLAQDENLRFELAKGALLRAQDFSWDKKAEMVNQIYHQKTAELGLGKT